MCHDAGTYASWLFRYLSELMDCPFCAGFWVSIAFQSVMKFNYLGHGFLGTALTTLAFAMIAGEVNYITHVKSEGGD